MSKKETWRILLRTVPVFIVAVLFLPVQSSGEKPVKEESLPYWSNELQCDGTACPRFTLVFDGAAVLDNETGLVWEQSPSQNQMSDWYSALSHCYTLELGGRRGWRVPTLEGLASLQDPSVPFPGPALPSGHPFTMQTGNYWSATTYAGNTAFPHAWVVSFSLADVFSNDKSNPNNRAWCVRSGHGHDAY
jgi:hypothetical protein